MEAGSCSEKEALQRFRTNPGARWSSGWDVEPVEGTAWQRIKGEEFLTPFLEPTFSIAADDRIFAIGSCFARTVEVALLRLGLAVDSVTDDFDQFDVEHDGGWQIGFTNKYNPFAVLNEMRWALEPGDGFPPAALQQVPDSTWIDPQAHYAVFGSTDLQTALLRHRVLTDLTRRLAACRIVIITLGLVEAFFDSEVGLYTNFTPRLDPHSERYRFCVLAYPEVMDALEAIHRCLSSAGHPDVQIVVTVSPVPLEGTFTGQDVVVANTLSKSTLRAAAGSWERAHDNVHYFPSYEIVTNSSSQGVWFADGRHVRPKIVRHIMETFLRSYVGAPAAPD